MHATSLRAGALIYPLVRRRTALTGRLLLLLSLATFLALTSPTQAQDPPNILLILLDDAGIENLSFYGLRGDFPEIPYADTDNMDLLVEDGIIFQNAWSNPLCSPTRAAIHTGSYAFRTGIGTVIDDDGTKGLDVSDEALLPRLLASSDEGTTAYATALFGKWHLGTAAAQGNRNAPRAAGYTNFFATFLDEQGAPGDLGFPFFHFWETRDGAPSPVTIHTEFDAHLDDNGTDNELIYLTSHMRDRAETWIDDHSDGGPWFAYVPFASAHEPWACPKNGSGTPYPLDSFECTGAPPDNDEEYRSMIETIDIEIGALLAAINPEETVVIIASDNGSPPELENAPWNANWVKGSVGQGGVRVPLLIVGAGVTEAAEEVDAAVSLTDLYATILDIAGKSDLIATPTDSMSLTRYFTDVDDGLVHEFNYTETFFPNFEPGSGFGPCRGQQAVQEDPSLWSGTTYKYVRTFDGNEALFELDGDFDEDTNLINNPPSQSRLDALRDHIDVTLDSDLSSICQVKMSTGGFCNSNGDCCSNLCNTTAHTCVCPTP